MPKSCRAITVRKCRSASYPSKGKSCCRTVCTVASLLLKMTLARSRCQIPTGLSSFLLVQVNHVSLERDTGLIELLSVAEFAHLAINVQALNEDLCRSDYHVG